MLMDKQKIHSLQEKLIGQFLKEILEMVVDLVMDMVK